MFKNKTIPLFISILVFICSCNNKNNCQNIESTKATVVSIDIKEYISPSPIYKIDSFFLFIDIYGKNCVNVYNLNTHTFKRYFFLGKGPSEITSPGPSFYDRKTNILYLSDWGKFVIWKISLTPLKHNAAPLIIGKIKIPGKVYPLFNPIIINDNLIAAWNPIDETQIVLFDSTGIQKQEILHNTLPYFNSVGFWNESKRIFFDKHPSKNKYATAAMYYDVVHVIDDKGRIIFSYEGNLNLQKKGQDKNPFKRIRTFSKVVCHEDFILCAYTGEFEYSNQTESGSRVLNYPKNIMIFNWNAELLYNIRVPEYVDFYFDEIHNSIYIAAIDANSTIKKIDLNELFYK